MDKNEASPTRSEVSVSAERIRRVCEHLNHGGCMRPSRLVEPEKILGFTFRSIFSVIYREHRDDYIYGIGDSSTGCMEIVLASMVPEVKIRDLNTVETKYVHAEMSRTSVIFHRGIHLNLWNTVIASSIDLAKHCPTRPPEEAAWSKSVCLIAFKKTMWEGLRTLPLFKDVGSNVPSTFLDIAFKMGAVKSPYDFTHEIQGQTFGLIYKTIESRNVCSVCNLTSDSDSLPKCSRCMKTRYCSPACQKADWVNHKTLCALGL
jgi:hypothetical protein